MAQVTFANWNRTIRVGALANLRWVARLAGLPLYNGIAALTNCRGMGLCGTCRVSVEPNDALTPPTGTERMHGCTGPMRLACQARVTGQKDLTVTKMSGYLGKGKTAVPA